MDRIVLPVGRRGSLTGLFACLVPAGLMTWLMISMPGPLWNSKGGFIENLPFLYFGGLVMLLLLVLIHSLYGYLCAPAAVILSKEKLTYQSLGESFEIAYSDIRSVYVGGVKPEEDNGTDSEDLSMDKGVYVIPKDFSKELDKASLVRAVGMAYSMGDKGSPYIIPEGAVDISSELLRGLIEERRLVAEEAIAKSTG